MSGFTAADWKTNMTSNTQQPSPTASRPGKGSGEVGGNKSENIPDPEVQKQLENMGLGKSSSSKIIQIINNYNPRLSWHIYDMNGVAHVHQENPNFNQPAFSVNIPNGSANS